MLLRLFSILVLCVTLTTPVAAQSAAPTAASSFSPAQQQEIRDIVREYLVSNPIVLDEAIKALQAQKKVEEEQQVSDVIRANSTRFYTAERTPVIGNPKGDVTIVEFFDYNCGYCRAIAPSLVELTKTDPGIRLVMRELPILSEESEAAARAALAANMQGKYAAFHDALMSSNGSIDASTIEDTAKALGLNADRFKQDMQSDKVRSEIRESHALAQDLGIHGTPAFVIGDKLYPGAISVDEMKTAITALRAEAKPR